MKNRKKQIKELIGCVISGNDNKSTQLIKELSESILVEKEDAIIESIFSKLARGKSENEEQK